MRAAELSRMGTPRLHAEVGLGEEGVDRRLKGRAEALSRGMRAFGAPAAAILAAFSLGGRMALSRGMAESLAKDGGATAGIPARAFRGSASESTGGRVPGLL
jgi:hypothetical protein